MAEKKETAKRKEPTKEAVHVKPAQPYALVTHKDLTVERSSIRPIVFAMWVRTLLQNWRQGTVAVKGRADVNRTGKKPWRQKGTGRARAGSARSPLWRGGGVTFGPQARTRKMKVPQGLRQRVMSDLLWQLVEEKRLYILDFIAEKPATKKAVQTLRDAGLQKKLTLLLDPQDIVMHASFANIPTVQLVFLDQLNAFNVAHGNQVIVLKKDFDKFKQMVAQWN